MAIPLIVSIVPATGTSGGRNLVEIKANNLRLPDPQPPTGPSEPRLPTVQVLFGGESATDVKVFTKGKLTCLTPAISTALSPGLIDVTIKNLDNNGDPIPTEEATRVDGYEYLRPDLTLETDFTRLVRTLRRKVKNEVIANTVMTSHTDFDGTTGDGLNRVSLAELPGIILVGPNVEENRFFSQNDRGVLEDGTGDAVIRRVPYTVDLSFDVIGVAEETVTVLNLLATTVQFFHRNKVLQLDRDPNDLSKGRVEYEMEMTDVPSVRGDVNNSNVRSFSGTMVIRGFDIEDLAGVTGDMVQDRTTEIEEIQIDSSNDLGSP